MTDTAGMVDTTDYSYSSDTVIVTSRYYEPVSGVFWIDRVPYKINPNGTQNIFYYSYDYDGHIYSYKFLSTADSYIWSGGNMVMIRHRGSYAVDTATYTTEGKAGKIGSLPGMFNPLIASPFPFRGGLPFPIYRMPE
jgi:hypothetical protein